VTEQIQGLVLTCVLNIHCCRCLTPGADGCSSIRPLQMSSSPNQNNSVRASTLPTELGMEVRLCH
jgi:hypothetical protein